MTLDLKVQTRVKVSKPGSQTRVVTRNQGHNLPKPGSNQGQNQGAKIYDPGLVGRNQGQNQGAKIYDPGLEGRNQGQTRVLRFMTLVWEDL